MACCGTKSTTLHLDVGQAFRQERRLAHLGGRHRVRPKWANLSFFVHPGTGAHADHGVDQVHGRPPARTSFPERCQGMVPRPGRGRTGHVQTRGPGNGHHVVLAVVQNGHQHHWSRLQQRERPAQRQTFHDDPPGQVCFCPLRTDPPGQSDGIIFPQTQSVTTSYRTRRPDPRADRGIFSSADA